MKSLNFLFLCSVEVPYSKQVFGPLYPFVTLCRRTIYIRSIIQRCRVVQVKDCWIAGFCFAEKLRRAPDSAWGLVARSQTWQGGGACPKSCSIAQAGPGDSAAVGFWGCGQEQGHRVSRQGY